MRKTKKIYYQERYKTKIDSIVVEVKGKTIELEETIAYPEGGGQGSDIGRIVNNRTNKIVNFNLVERKLPNRVKISKNQSVNVDGIIVHYIEGNDVPLEKMFEAGDYVTIEIDPIWRQKLSASHTASHLLYMAIEEVRPDMIPGTIGCHIKDGQARFDFRTDRRVSIDEMSEISVKANKLIERKLDIDVFESKEHPDARYWKCLDSVIACGGTHLRNTCELNKLKIKRKNIGKNKERVICVLENTTYSIENYTE